LKGSEDLRSEVTEDEIGADAAWARTLRRLTRDVGRSRAAVPRVADPEG